MDHMVLTREEPSPALPASAELLPDSVWANVTASNAERLIAVSPLALLVAHDGVATVQVLVPRAIGSMAEWVTADPTQAVLVRASGRVTIDRGSCTANGFSVISLRAKWNGTPHTRESWPGVRLESLGFPAAAASLRSIPWNPQRFFRLLWLQHQLRRVAGSGCSVEGLAESARQEGRALFNEAIGACTSHHASSRRSHVRASTVHRQLTESAKRLVASAPERPHLLAEVARALSASPHHLAHVFPAQAGVPFLRFLLDLRVAISLTRLSHGDLHLSTLALDLGFATHSHFTAAFRRAVGLPPTRMRRALESGEPPFAARGRIDDEPAAGGSDLLFAHPQEHRDGFVMQRAAMYITE